MLWIKIKSRLLLLYRSFLLKYGFKKRLLRNRYGERILVFHGVDSVGETRFNSRFFSIAYFEEFIQYILKHYNVISLEEYYAKKFKSNTLNIALTFDDGYLNNYELVVPILEKYNVPACFYITTIHEKDSYLFNDFIDLITFHTSKQAILFQGGLYQKNSKNQFMHNGVSLKNVAKSLTYNDLKSLYSVMQKDWINLKPESLAEYWQLMNAQQIKAIAKNPLFTIGSHGETHASLIHIPIERAKNEIRNSKKTLEAICEQPIEEFAFPFGFYTEELANYCLELGYKKVLLVDYNTKEDEKNDVLKNRFVMNPYISMDLQLVCLLNNSYY